MSPPGLPTASRTSRVRGLSTEVTSLRRENGSGLGESLYRAIVDTAVDAIVVIDRNGAIRSVNNATERLFGYATGELIGRNVKLLMPDPYAGEHDTYLANYLRTGRKKIIGIGREVVGRRKDGSVFPMDLSVGEARDGDEPLFVGIIRDITDRKAAELARRESELRLRSILDTVPDAIVVINAQGIIQSFSPAAERLFGYDSAGVVGRNVNILMPAPYQEAHDGYLARYLRTRKRRIIGFGRVVVGLRKSGETFPMELQVGEFSFAGSGYFTGFVRDLTERQEAERRIQDLQAELVHASRLSMMGQMASTMAHELNQPLTAVINYLEAGRQLLAGGAGAPERVGEVLEKAVAQVHNAPAMSSVNCVSSSARARPSTASKASTDWSRNRSRSHSSGRSSGASAHRSSSTLPCLRSSSTLCKSSRSCSTLCATPSRPWRRSIGANSSLARERSWIRRWRKSSSPTPAPGSRQSWPTGCSSPLSRRSRPVWGSDCRYAARSSRRIVVG